MTRQEWLVQAMAPSGNLFLLITLPELRRQGLTYLAFYALQRTVEQADLSEGLYSEYGLRRETGLEDYEVSRACRLLEKSGLVELLKAAGDRRLRDLSPTYRGRRILDNILSAAADRLWAGIQVPGRIRRTTEARELQREVEESLLQCAPNR